MIFEILDFVHVLSARIGFWSLVDPKTGKFQKIKNLTKKCQKCVKKEEIWKIIKKILKNHKKAQKITKKTNFYKKSESDVDVDVDVHIRIFKKIQTDPKMGLTPQTSEVWQLNIKLY